MTKKKKKKKSWAKTTQFVFLGSFSNFFTKTTQFI